MPGSSPCVGLSVSRDHEMAGGEVQADAVLERRVGLVVEVDPDVVLAQQSLELVGVDAEGDVEEVELVLGRREEALAVLGRAPDEQHARRARRAAATCA